MNIHYGFILNCMTTSDREVIMESENFILKKFDLLGREVDKNIFEFYFYDDGRVEKIIILD